MAHSKSSHHWGHVKCKTWGWEMAGYCREGDTFLVLRVGMQPCPYHCARLISKVQTSGKCVLYVFFWMVDFSHCEWFGKLSVHQSTQQKSSLNALDSGCWCFCLESLHLGKQNFLPTWIWQWKGFLSKNESCFTTNCMTCVRFWKSKPSSRTKMRHFKNTNFKILHHAFILPHAIK